MRGYTFCCNCVGCVQPSCRFMSAKDAVESVSRRREIVQHKAAAHTQHKAKPLTGAVRIVTYAACVIVFLCAPERASSTVRPSPTVFLLALPALFLALSSWFGCGRARVATGPISARAVLRQAEVAGVRSSEVVAWTPDLGHVVVTGRRGGKHVVVVAYRDPQSPESRWTVARVSVMLGDGKKRWDVWVLGNREYDLPPTSADIRTLLTELHGPAPEEFVFKPQAKR